MNSRFGRILFLAIGEFTGSAGTEQRGGTDERIMVSSRACGLLRGQPRLVTWPTIFFFFFCLALPDVPQTRQASGLVEPHFQPTGALEDTSLPLVWDENSDRDFPDSTRSGLAAVVSVSVIFALARRRRPD